MRSNQAKSFGKTGATLLLALSTVFVNSFAYAQSATDFPKRPITLIVPTAPGGSADITARIIAKPLGELLSVPVVVDYRAGAGGLIGMQFTANAQPDGYTIALGTASGLTSNPLTNKASKVSPLEDLTAIIPLASMPGVIAVHESYPARTLADFVKEAQARPDHYPIGSSGTGSIGHLWAEAMNQELRINLRHIPYRGVGPALTAALGGETQVFIDQYPSAKPHLISGKLKAIAIANDRRLGDFPNLPTLKEAGYEELNAVMSTWFGIVGPAQMPDDLVQKLNASLKAVLTDPKVVKQLSELGAEPIPAEPSVLTKMIADGLSRNQDFIQRGNLKFE